MVVGRVDCADALLHAYHALHVLRDSGYDVPCPLHPEREIQNDRSGQKLCRAFIGSHNYLLWVQLSREPEAILTMVLASRRHRIWEWHFMGAVQRLLSSQVLGFQASTVPDLLLVRVGNARRATDCLKKAADEHTAEIIHITG